MTRTCSSCGGILRSTRPPDDVLCSACEMAEREGASRRVVMTQAQIKERSTRRREEIVGILARQAMTSPEVAKVMGCRRQMVSDDMRVLLEAGRVERAGMLGRSWLYRASAAERRAA